MYPFISLFGKQISTYTIMATICILISGYLACRLVRKKGYNDNDMIMLLLIAALGVYLGGHILYGITNINKLYLLIIHIGNTPNIETLFEAIMDIFGGSVFYGGLIGGMVAGYIYIKKKKLQYNIFADIATIIIPLFHFFGRIGCFLVGCCFGVESHIGFTFENSPLEVANHVHRFPIQLVEATYNLCLFIILYNLLKRSKLKGKLLGLYLILYPVGRFIFEFFRGDEYRGFLFGLSTSQIISIILLFIGIYILTKKEKNSSSK